GWRRVRSARGRAGFCGWRCGAWAWRNYPLSRLPPLPRALHDAQLGAELGQAAAADFEGVLAVAEHGVDAAVAIAAQFHQFVAGVGCGLAAGERALGGGGAELGHGGIIRYRGFRGSHGPYTMRSWVRSWGRQRRLTSRGCSPWRSTAWTRPSASRRSSISSWRATRQLRWMRTKRSPNSSSSDFSDSSIRSRPRAWYTTTYCSSACR